MKRWTLMFAALLLAGFAAPTRAADVDPLWPAESQQVMKINVKQILESDIVKKYALAQIKQAMEGKDAQKMLKDLGIDPLKDIESLSVGLWNDDPNDPKGTKGLVILRGKFDPAKLFDQVEKAIEKAGDKLSIVKEGDTKLVKITVDQLPEPLFATMADDKTVLLGTDKKLVMNGIKVVDTKAKPVIKEDLAELVKAMDDKASFFGCGISNGKVGDIPQIPNVDVEKLKKQLENMVSSSMTLRVTGDISIEVGMAMKNTESADDFGATLKEMMDMVRTFLPFIVMQAPQAKPIVDELKKSLNTKVDGKIVKLNIKLSGDAIGKAVGVEE